jgi:quercetin dioxygenase-like cupin family protein
VLKGAYVYEPQRGEKITVGPGEYLVVPARTPHVSSGDPKDGAMFYEESLGKFDLLFVKQEAKR